MNTLLQGKELKKRAIELGIDIQGSEMKRGHLGNYPLADDHELQRRVIEAERSSRESMLWLIALVSAIASVVSASTAIIVVLAK